MFKNTPNHNKFKIYNLIFTIYNSNITKRKFEYMPSGEQFAEQRSTWGTNYKFNSKELDQETGLYYYGARYYTPEIGIWLSVDPLSDKYPSMSAYMYCAGNPVILIDPDGRDVEPTNDQNILNMLNPNHSSYNKAFADKYNELDSDHSTIYRFNKFERAKGDSDFGFLSYEGKKDNKDVIGINYSDGNNTSVSKENPLLEETYHATQFMKGDLGLKADGSGSFALDQHDEATAKLFAAQNIKGIGTSIERGIIKANAKNGIDGVIDFISNRPSMMRTYGGLEKGPMNVNEAVSGNNKFKTDGTSNIPSLIMRRPK